MARLITLSRAARLVGVKRSTLQKRIRAGELHTFEGQLDLSELLRVYPQTEVEDSAMLERSERIVEQALGRVVREQETLPDVETLATRVAGLGHELARASIQLRRFAGLITQIEKKIESLAASADDTTAAGYRQLAAWLQEHKAELERPFAIDEEMMAADNLLRVMAAHVHVEPSGHEFFVQGNDSLLEAGLRAGLALDYGCTDGHCGRCRARIVSGTIKPIRTQQALGLHEREQGYALMCCNTAVTDVVLQAPEAERPADIPLQQLDASVRRIERLSDEVTGLTLRAEQGRRLRFLAGQSVRLRLPGGAGAVLPVAACPCEETSLEFHVTREGTDSAFAEQVFGGLALGERVGVEGPLGDFVLQQDSLRSPVFLVWHTGFAPIKSMLENAMALDQAEKIFLYWLVPAGARPYQHNRCRAWADALDNLVYRAIEVPATGTAPADISGVLSDIAEQHFNLASYDFYLSMPGALLTQCRQYFSARGVPVAQIRVNQAAA